MKLIGLTKLTTSNLLSLLGYPCILLSIYNEFIFAPFDWTDLEGYNYDRDMLGSFSVTTTTGICWVLFHSLQARFALYLSVLSVPRF